MADYAIETRSLTKKFGKVTAFTDVSLQVPVGSITCLLGPSDSGKTSLLESLLQIIHPSSGTASVLGMDIASQSMAIRQNVGYGPEDPVFDVAMTPYSTLKFAAGFLLHGKELEETIAQTLELIGFKGQENKLVSKLDRQERARLAVGQAFAAAQPVVMLDQPTKDLDPIDRDELLDMVIRFQRRTSATVLFTSRLVEDATFATHLAYLIKGRLVLQKSRNDITGGVEDVFDQRRDIEKSFKAEIEALQID